MDMRQFQSVLLNQFPPYNLSPKSVLLNDAEQFQSLLSRFKIQSSCDWETQTRNSMFSLVFDWEYHHEYNIIQHNTTI
jgi:hypothetical protein